MAADGRGGAGPRVAPGRRPDLRRAIATAASRPRLTGLLGAAFALAIVIARRTDQLTDPQVWAEDGTEIVPTFLEHGVSGFLTPVNGYLITIPKLVSFAALKLGGLEHYPAVSTVLGLGVTAAALVTDGTDVRRAP